MLIGDSGEKDPEIYADIVRAQPGRILAVYIREVRLDPGDGRVEAVSDAWYQDVPFVLATTATPYDDTRPGSGCSEYRAHVTAPRRQALRACRRGACRAWSWRESNPRPRASNQVFSGCSLY